MSENKKKYIKVQYISKNIFPYANWLYFIRMLILKWFINMEHGTWLFIFISSLAFIARKIKSDLIIHNVYFQLQFKI